MNRITDIVISTQLCTCVAAVLAVVAHFIDNGTILNPNWDWAVYFCLVIAVFFMLLPHLICQEHPVLHFEDEYIRTPFDEYVSSSWDKTDRYSLDVEECINKPVIPYTYPK